MKINRTEMLIHSVTKLLHRDADAHIIKMLKKSHPSEVAALLRQLSTEDARKITECMRGLEIEAETFVELEGKFLQAYLDWTDDKAHVIKLFQELPEDEVAGLLSDIDEDLSEELLSLMRKTTQDEVKEILQYEEDTCGRAMAVNVFHMSQEATAKETIEEIQNSSELESVFYVYVVDEFEKLVGVVSLRQILQVRSNRKLKTFMTTDVIRVNVHDNQEKASHFVEEYNFVSLPVVEDDDTLAGMITVDDVIDLIRDEAQDEVLQIAGVESEAIDDFSFWRAFGFRILWFGLLFLGGVFSSELILHYYSHFPRDIHYLCFAPLILRLGGSVTTQTMAFMHQSLLSDDIERQRAAKAFRGQVGTTLLVTILLALAVMGYDYYRLSFDLVMPLGLGLGLVTVAVLSTLIGMIVPYAFDKMNLDSVTQSSRFVHFLMDVISLYIFFQFLWLWRNLILKQPWIPFS